MKNARTILSAISFVIIFLMVLCAVSFAEMGILPGKIGDYGKYFDQNKVQSFSGKVLDINQVEVSSRLKLFCTAIRVERADDEGEEIVYLGTKTKLDEAGFSIARGQDVCIIGSKVDIDGEVVVIAQQLNLGNYIISLRDITGRHSFYKAGRLSNDNEDGCQLAYVDF